MAHLGDYELLEEIGRGGMGIVYRARQASLDRTVAVKLLPFGGLGGKEAALRLRAEAVAAGSLRHPNIVAVHEVGLREGQHFIVMDFVAGPSLAQVLRNGPLSARRAAMLVREVALAVQHAHERGIIHRDLKPSNILLDAADDQPRITDFGLAKNLRSDTQLTLTGQTLGSPNYIPPEQIRTRRREAAPTGESAIRNPKSETSRDHRSPAAAKISFASDVYALGATLYHALAGRPAFIGDEVAAVLEQAVHEEPLAPRRLNPSVPVDLETICLKCLEKEPGRRYATARELAEELGRFLDKKPIVARPVGAAGRAWRWCRREPAVAGLIAAVHLALVLGLTGVLWRWRRVAASELAARQHRYVSDMNLAQHVWREGNAKRAQSLLRNYVPKPGERDLRGFEWRYLWNLCAQDDSRYAFTYFGYEVSDVAHSPDGKLLAVAAGQVVRFLDVASRREVLELRDEQGGDPIRRIAWSPVDAHLLATAGSSGSVKLWNLGTKGVSLFTYHPSEALRSELSGIAFSPDGKLLALASRLKATTLALWRLEPKTVLWSTNLDDPPSVVVFSPNGQELISGGGESGNLTRWEVATGKELEPFSKVHTGWLRNIAATLDGRTLATSGLDNRLVLWDFQTGKPKMPPLDISSLGVGFSPDGRLLALGGPDGLIRVLDVATGQRIALLRGHVGPVR